MLGSAPRLARKRRGVLKHWPPVCPTGACDVNKGCVCKRQRSSVAGDYYDVVKLIYNECDDIPATRPGEDDHASFASIASIASTSSTSSTSSVDTIELFCDETLEEDCKPRTKRVHWAASPSPSREKSGLNLRWQSVRVVLCIEEELELSYHDGTKVSVLPVPEGSCYLETVKP